MCTTLYPDSCIHYSFLTVRILVSIHHRTVDLLYPCCLPTKVPPFSLVTTNPFFVSVFFILFCLFTLFFYIAHKSEITQFLSFSIRVITLSIIPSRSIHIVKNGKIPSFVLWLSSIPLHIYIPHLL